MIFAPIDEKSVTYATSRVRDFIRVHRTRKDNRWDAMDRMAEALGFGSDQRHQLANEILDYVDEESIGYVILGAVLGLYMAENESNIADQQLLGRG